MFKQNKTKQEKHRPSVLPGGGVCTRSHTDASLQLGEVGSPGPRHHQGAVVPDRALRVHRTPSKGRVLGAEARRPGQPPPARLGGTRRAAKTELGAARASPGRAPAPGQAGGRWGRALRPARRPRPPGPRGPRARRPRRRPDATSVGPEPALLAGKPRYFSAQCLQNIRFLRKRLVYKKKHLDLPKTTKTSKYLQCRNTEAISPTT